MRPPTMLPQQATASEDCREPKGDTALRSPPATRNLGGPAGAPKARRGASPGWRTLIAAKHWNLGVGNGQACGACPVRSESVSRRAVVALWRKCDRRWRLLRALTMTRWRDRRGKPIRRRPPRASALPLAANSHPSRMCDPPVFRVPEDVDRVPGDVPDPAVVDQVPGLVEQREGRQVARHQRVGAVEEQLALARAQLRRRLQE